MESNSVIPHYLSLIIQESYTKKDFYDASNDNGDHLAGFDFLVQDRYMIQAKYLRSLQLESASAPDRPSYLSAASGLVRIGKNLYVVADDEHHLGVFSATDSTPGRLIQLLPETLPNAKNERKAVKPDFEALVCLPASERQPYGALLAVGSGSTVARRNAVLLPIDADGAVGICPSILDLSSLYDMLGTHINELNIEGIAVHKNCLTLLHRGNVKNPKSACIKLDILDFYALAFGTNPGNPTISYEIIEYALGEIKGVPLCFSDAVALPNGDLIFSAIAEDTTDSYNDGTCVGAAVGIIKADGSLHTVLPLNPLYKVEGIDARMQGTVVHLTLVTDADEPGLPASLLAAEISDYLCHDDFPSSLNHPSNTDETD